jgi:hypothetical protein
MLASITSVKSIGEQLWVRILGVPSSGKTTLCEGLSVARKYVIAKSTMRGFHSGWRSSDGNGNSQDSSLIAEIKHRGTLVTKDGDTLLRLPNLPQILSEARDLYDTVTRASYRNSMSRDYAGIRMTWILCGTNTLRQLDSSELGERFLDCSIVDKMDDETEDAIGWRVANRAARAVATEVDGKPETQYEPELAQAMQLTGGYVCYLRENAQKLLSEIKISEEALRQCMWLGKFVAYMRTRLGKQRGDVEEETEREMSFRLISQHVRLAHCLAVVLNCKEVDREVMRRVTKVALDTSRGSTFEVAKRLYNSPHGMEPYDLSIQLGEPEERTRKLLRFLRKVGVVEPLMIKNGNIKSPPRWRLTDPLALLYKRVVVNARVPT